MPTDRTPPKPIDLRLERFSSQLNVKQEAGKRMIFGAIRKKWLVLQPEEFVRQLLVHFLINDMRYNRNRVTVERGVKVNSRARRTDILIFDNDMRTYNGPLRVPYLMISNGRESIIAEIDFAAEDYRFLDAVPEWR